MRPKAALVAALMLGGCAPDVALNRPQLALPAQYEAQPPQHGPDRPTDRWWELFDDAQLAALVEQALADSTDIRSAYFRLIEARAIRDQARTQRLPTGAFGGNAARQDGEPLSGTDLPGSTTRTDSLGATFSASWEIDLFGRLAAVGRAADADYAAAAFDYHAVRQSMAADVATALFQARGFAVQLNDARESLRIATTLAATARLALERGLVATGNAARLEGNEASARAEVRRLEAALRNAKRSLLILAGRMDAPTDSLIIDARQDVPPPVPPAMPAMLLARRPDVRAAEARLLAATAQLDVGRLALFPRFTLSGSGSISRTETLGVDGTAGLWSLAAGLALPVLDRARLIAQLRASEARGQRAVVAYEAAVQSAFRDADIALATVASDGPRLDDLVQAEARAAYAFAAARRAYGAGLTDLTGLLQQEQTWRDARSAMTGARTLALINQVTAFRALGGGWDGAAPGTAEGQPDLPRPSPLSTPEDRK